MNETFIAPFSKTKRTFIERRSFCDHLDLCSAGTACTPERVDNIHASAVSLRFSFEAWKISIGHGHVETQEETERSKPICAKAVSSWISLWSARAPGERNKRQAIREIHPRVSWTRERKKKQTRAERIVKEFIKSANTQWIFQDH